MDAQKQIDAARKKVDDAIAEFVQTIARSSTGPGEEQQNAVAVGWVLAVDHKLFNADVGYLGGFVRSYAKPEQAPHTSKMIVEHTYEQMLQAESGYVECDRVHVDELEDDE